MPGLHFTDENTDAYDLPSLIKDADGPEPIAIIGIGCRLPGDVSSASECWEFLQAGRNARSEFPRSRFNIDAYYSSKKGNPGTLPMRGGYFLNQDIRHFDNGFFGINNLEATFMDPQQRNLLEVVYECLESAGVKLEDVAGSNVGCYVGDFVYDFLVMQAKDHEGFHRYSPTGKGRTILSNRISHAFDFRGPSLTLDTACSSSLYCLHTACRALLQKDCDAAVVASANLIQTPEQQMDVAASGVLSPTSTCHTFDASADGYGRADAVGALYLKRLSDAIRDNDPIRSIIRATSTNSNGQTPGITLPSDKCQVEVIKKAYEFVGLNVGDTDYFECHGTGTPVGDPIEVSAVAQSQSSAVLPDKRQQLLIGSVKPSFGHSEAASGITSIIKATLALEHLQIPTTVGIQELNPNIPWTEYNIAVARTLTPWPRLSKYHIPRVSINSFGYGGANAHCILDNAGAWIDRLLMLNQLSENEESIDTVAMFPELDDEQAFILPFSARNPESLTRRMKTFADLDVPAAELLDLAYTLSMRRSIFEYRSFVVVRGSSWPTDFETAGNTATSHITDTSKSPLTFVFTGQGAHWPRMGKRLYTAYSPFRNSILRLEYHLRSLPGSPSWSLTEVIVDGDNINLQQPLLSQTVCTAIQIALVDLLQCWNIVPDSVVGHSSGEIAAAYAAGHISATYAIEIAYLRGQVVSNNKTIGSMMVASMSYDEAQELIDQHDLAATACVACHNSPESVTLSGDEQVIDFFHKTLQETGRFSRKLQTGGQAYHSHHMKKFGAVYQSLLKDALHREKYEARLFSKDHQPIAKSPKVLMVSTVLDRPVTSDDTTNPAYWRANLESPVLFKSAIDSLVKDQTRTFVEIGPHHSLQTPVEQIESAHRTSGTRSVYLSALVRNKCSETTALTLVGKLWTHGYDVDFEVIRRSYRWCSKAKPKVLHSLPNYTWDHSQILWKEPRSSVEFRNRKFPRDEFIGAKVSGSNGRTSTWRGLLNLKNVPWLVDHKLGVNIVLPGACYISMASRACQQLLSSAHETNALEFRNVKIEKVMLLRPDSSLEVFTELCPLRMTSLDDHVNAWEFIISSMEDDRFTRHASGIIEALSSVSVSPIPVKTHKNQLEPQSSKLWYSKFKEQSLAFGSSFQSLDSISIPRQRDQMVAEADIRSLPEDVMNEFRDLYPFDVHPIITDAMFQTGLIATAKGELEHLSGRVPVSIERLHIFRAEHSGTEKVFKARASAKLVGPGSALGQCELIDLHGAIALQVQNVRVAALQEMEIISTPRVPIQKTEWIPDLSKIGKHNIEEFTKILSSVLPGEQTGAVSEIAAFTTFKTRMSAECKILYVGNVDTTSINTMSSALNQVEPSSDMRLTVGLPQESDTILCLDMIDWKTPEMTEFADRGLPLNELAAKYDIIILYDTSNEKTSKYQDRASLYKHLKPTGFVLSVGDAPYEDTSDSGIFMDDSSSSSEKDFEIDCQDSIAGIDATILNLPATHEGDNIIVASIKKTHKAHQGQTVLIVTGDSAHPLDMVLFNEMQADGFATTIIAFDHLTADQIQNNSKIVVTVELEASVVARASIDQFAQVQLLANYASKVIWVFSGDLASLNGPENCTILGLSRSIMAGNPAIQFTVLEVESSRSQIACTVANIHSIIQAMEDQGADLEYLQKDGVLFVSRLLPANSCNEGFEQKKRSTLKLIALSQASEYELHIRDPGQFDTLEFRHSVLQQDLLPNHVEVSVKAVGMNAKDLYTLSGKVDTEQNTCSCEFSGVITAVGSLVTEFGVGDRIVSSAPGRYKPKERIPTSVCYKLREEEDFVQLAAVPMVYGTAIHALQNLAKLQPGESVLIHSAAGGVGTAAILLAKSIGATIYATAGTDKKKSYLVDYYDLNPDHIFNSRDTSFLPAILKATNGVGVDVVLNSLTGSRLHASLDACAKFGRFIEIGKRDILDAGNLNLSVFQKGITFSAFDLHELYYSTNPTHRRTYEKLLVDAVDFYRTLGYAGNTTTSFDISDISSAFRYFANSSRIGKVAITYEDQSSLVPFVAPKFEYRFSAHKSYLLIGCLGGLGRSISRYMFQNGARNFTFLARSGASKPAAAMLVADLEQTGASVKVITGDVCSLSDVQTAVQSLTYPLGGIIQAAMGLSEALFPAMTHSAWHTALDPKIRGTWNIHKAISSHEKELDFFLMTSSIAGTIGFSTEANYCAANSYLDHFAAFRRKQGLRATSIGLGPVAGAGIVHEHPEIEKIFFRGGITELSEDDMLCVIDIALSQQEQIGHLITGLEPDRAKPGFEDSWEMLAPDPRLCHITSAHRRARATATNTSTSAGSSTSNSTLDPRLTSALQAQAKRSPDTDTDTETQSLSTTLHEILADLLAKLILTQPDKISSHMYLADIGMDSTLAAQFRTYIYRATGVDVSFVMLMDARSRVGDVVGFVEGRLTPADEDKDKDRDKDKM